MRKFLGTLVILAMIVAAVGYYRGWYDISTDDRPGETNIEMTIDKDKIKQDAEAARQKASEFAADQNDQDRSIGRARSGGRRIGRRIGCCLDRVTFRSDRQ